MGLFDNVKCEVPLPDGGPTTTFQTKTFEDPYLETYIIRADGRLIHDRPRYDIDPEGTPHGMIDTNYHGVLNFYDYDDGVWREFNAKFTDGNLVSIEQITDRAEEHAS